MFNSHRRLVATGVVLSVALALSACTVTDSNEPNSGNGVKVEGTVPLTVANTASWKASILKDAPTTVTPLGVLTYSEKKSKAGESYAPALLSPEDGSTRWVGEPLKSEKMPALEWVQDGVSRWVVAETSTDNKVTLTVWNGLGGRQDLKPTASATFEGDSAPPQVTFSGAGVLVAGATKTSAEPFTFWPKDATTTRYKGGPERNGKPGVPIGAYGDGFLVSFPDGGFSFASSTGGWSSTDSVPKGAESSSGVVLAQESGYVISKWAPASAVKDGEPILAVHSATSGELFAQYALDSDAQSVLSAQEANATAVVLDANKWLVWGRFGFNLIDGTGASYTLEGGTPVAVIDNLLYAKGAYEPLAPAAAKSSASPSASGSPSPSMTPDSPTPSPTGSVAPDAPEGFSGVVGVDLVTSQPMAGLPSLYPVGRSSTGQVILRDDANRTIYSVSLR